MARGRLRSLALMVSPVMIISLSGAARSAQTDKYVCGDGGMAVTACPEATRVAAGILMRGGNSVDAAVAAGLALAVTFPEAGNLGGGGFMLLRTPDGESAFIDFRETAPSAASRDMYIGGDGEVIRGASRRGHLASGVPGTVAGLHLAHGLHGSMEWKELVEPSIELASSGFALGERLAASLRMLVLQAGEYPGLSKFMRADGKPYEAGDIFRQPDLASTLRRIADGPEDFYAGETASLIAREMREGGGLIDAEDLARYRAVVREPVTGDYRGYDVISAPPPSSGGVVLIEILNILGGFEDEEAARRDARWYHRVIEAEKRAYCDRAHYLGDPDFVDMPTKLLVSRGYADRVRATIGGTATPSRSIEMPLRHGEEREETTHYSIIDSEGGCVAVTTTLNGSFGSCVVVRGAGFLMNNEMDDFSVKPGYPNMYGLIGGEANSIEPGKRMLSSMTPTIVMDGQEPFLVLGTPGGSTIITTVAQIMIDIIDLGMSPGEAVSAPRFHHQWLPDRVFHERDAFSPSIASELEEMGHVLEERRPIGDAQVICIEGGRRCGVSDPRGGGSARSAETPTSDGFPEEGEQ